MILRDLNKNLYRPFLWMGFNCLKATEPLRGSILLLTTNLPEIPGTHLIDFARIKGWVDQQFWKRDPWIANPAPEPLGHKKSATSNQQNICFLDFHKANQQKKNLLFSKLISVTRTKIDLLLTMSSRFQGSSKPNNNYKLQGCPNQIAPKHSFFRRSNSSLTKLSNFWSSSPLKTFLLETPSKSSCPLTWDFFVALYPLEKQNYIVRISVSWFGKYDPFFIFPNALFPT